MIKFLDNDLRDILASSPFATRAVLSQGDSDRHFNVGGFFNSPLRENERAAVGTAPQAGSIAQDTTFSFQLLDGQIVPKRGDIFSIEGRKYEARKVLTDGIGMATVSLHEVEE
jgi:hypothetical protein